MAFDISYYSSHWRSYYLTYTRNKITVLQEFQYTVSVFQAIDSSYRLICYERLYRCSKAYVFLLSLSRQLVQVNEDYMTFFLWLKLEVYRKVAMVTTDWSYIADRIRVYVYRLTVQLLVCNVKIWVLELKFYS